MKKYVHNYIKENHEEILRGDIYMGLGKIADSVFDFNEVQYEKGARSIFGIDFPVGEDWWEDAKDTWANNNYDLIRSDMQKYIGNINHLTEQAVTTGATVKSLREQIRALDDKISKSRANFIARDQIGKLNGQITQMRMESIGLTMYVWETAGDEKVRSTHRPMDGALCRWDDSTVLSEDEGKTWRDRPLGAVKLHPGQDYQCRCTATAYWQELVGEADSIIDKDERIFAEIMGMPLSDEQITKLNDAGVLIDSEKSLQKGIKDFKQYVQNMEEPYKSIYSKYIESTVIRHDDFMVRIGYDPDPKVDAILYHKKSLKSLYLNANMVLSHELAHRYDVLEIKSWENKEFLRAIETASKKIQMNIKKYDDLYKSLKDSDPGLSDIISALSDNKIKTAYRHGSWDEKTKALEIFANTSYIKSNNVKLPEFDGLLDEIMQISNTMFKGAK